VSRLFFLLFVLGGLIPVSGAAVKTPVYVRITYFREYRNNTIQLLALVNDGTKANALPLSVDWGPCTRVGVLRQQLLCQVFLRLTEAVGTGVYRDNFSNWIIR
jgi:hypothetical protein